MTKTPSIFLGERFDDRTLIESIVAGFYIVDYGFIAKVNADKTVNVIHAKKLKTLEGKTLPETITKNVEVLTIAGRGFSINFDYQKGDRVLLLGLKNLVEKADKVVSSTETTAYMHYSRETLKAIPMCVFNSDAKVKIDIKDGTLSVETTQDINIKASGKINVEAKSDIALTANGKINVEAKSDVSVKGGGKVNVEATSQCTVKSPNTKLTGGIVEIGGMVAPTGSGALCGLPSCLFTGAPHVGNQASGT